MHHTIVFRSARMLACVVPLAAASHVYADDQAELAKQLSNPVAALINVPFQYNWDTDIGPEEADRSQLNIQPVIPFTLSENWNIISRTIIPLIDAESTTATGKDRSGLGDILQSIFFSPKDPTANGWIYGAGPALLFPSATDDALGGEKWGAGPTAVALRQENGWTYGGLANHIWSYAGENDRSYISATFIQPFLTYTTSHHTTFAFNSESTYDWHDDQWTIPLNAMISQLVKFGNQPVSFQLGYRYYAEAPDYGPDWGLRFSITFLFPK